jgi:Domain of unknown function (DUF1844)
MDKAPLFTVTDRRKFTSDGELREGETSSLDDATPSAASAPAAGDSAPAPAISQPEPAVSSAAAGLDEAPDAIEESEFEASLGPEPTAAETAEQHAAYQRSSSQIESMLRQANPGAPPSVEMDFEQLVQSIYLSAIVAMGAGAEPGQKPRIDIMGARQSIDMLEVLQKKTKGNLTEQEQRLLQNAVFNLRMMFLEITNAIASSAQRPPAGAPPRPPKR